MGRLFKAVSKYRAFASIYVQRLRDVPIPEYKTDMSAGFDLAIPEAVTLAPHESLFVKLGLVIQAPVGHMLLIAPRSSTYRNWGVDLGNTIGIVDEDYCGPEDELMLFVRNLDDDTKIIPAGTRLAQGIFIPVTRGIFLPQKDAIAESRGGWGSTGA